MSRSSNVADATSAAERDAGFFATSEAMRQRTTPIPKAIFCGDDLICMGAMDQARMAGFIGEKSLGFIRVNGMQMAGRDSYGITSIRQPLESVVSCSVELMLSFSDCDDPGKQIRLLPTDLIERCSLRAFVGKIGQALTI